MFNLGGLYSDVQSTLFIADTEGPQVRVHIRVGNRGSLFVSNLCNLSLPGI